MPPRPIHRWKTLWAGILILAFLSWAWWDSTRYSTFIRYSHYSISHSGSGICLADLKREVPSSPPAPSSTSYRLPIPATDETWAQARLEAPGILRRTSDPEQISLYYRQSGEFEPRNSAARHFKSLLSKRGMTGSIAIFLPHWLLIATFLIPWATYLLWRTRRLKRLARQGRISV